MSFKHKKLHILIFPKKEFTESKQVETSCIGVKQWNPAVFWFCRNWICLACCLVVSWFSSFLVLGFVGWGENAPRIKASHCWRCLQPPSPLQTTFTFTCNKKLIYNGCTYINMFNIFWPTLREWKSKVILVTDSNSCVSELISVFFSPTCKVTSMLLQLYSATSWSSCSSWRGSCVRRGRRWEPSRPMSRFHHFLLFFCQKLTYFPGHGDEGETTSLQSPKSVDKGAGVDWIEIQERELKIVLAVKVFTPINLNSCAVSILFTHKADSMSELWRPRYLGNLLRFYFCSAGWRGSSTE